MRFRCPDSISGICTETRCGCYLIHPRVSSRDKNGEPRYTAACVFDGSLRYYDDLLPEAEHEASATVPSEGQERETKIEKPDLSDKESCKLFCSRLYQAIRLQMKSSIHSETQAVDYILADASKGDLYYKDCELARKIQRDNRWKRSTFTNYCKSGEPPKAKGYKRAAKRTAKQERIKRELDRL